jgi:hypothetical protein
MLVLIWSCTAARAQGMPLDEVASNARFNVVDLFWFRPLHEDVPANGEPLWVESHIETSRWKTTEKTGEITYKDERGQTVGTASVYEEVSHEKQFLAWQGMQGDQPLDDVDFFRIVGHEDTADRILSGR